MPVLTAAPLPLLYGWRTTCAPAPVACAPVSSFEPSSTTRISCHDASARRSRTSGAIEAPSLNAGMTIDVTATLVAMAIAPDAADEPLNNTFPCDHFRPVISRIAERRGKPRAAGQLSERTAERFR